MVDTLRSVQEIRGTPVKNKVNNSCYYGRIYQQPTWVPLLEHFLDSIMHTQRERKQEKEKEVREGKYYPTKPPCLTETPFSSVGVL